MKKGVHKPENKAGVEESARRPTEGSEGVTCARNPKISPRTDIPIPVPAIEPKLLSTWSDMSRSVSQSPYQEGALLSCGNNLVYPAIDPSLVSMSPYNPQSLESGFPEHEPPQFYHRKPQDRQQDQHNHQMPVCGNTLLPYHSQDGSHLPYGEYHQDPEDKKKPYDYNPPEISQWKQQQQKGQSHHFSQTLTQSQVLGHGHRDEFLQKQPQFVNGEGLPHHTSLRQGQKALEVLQQQDYSFQPPLDLEGFFDLGGDGSASSSLNPSILPYDIHSHCVLKARSCAPEAIQTLSDSDKIASLAEALMSDFDEDPKCVVGLLSLLHII